MAIGSGIGSSVGVSAEATGSYGVYVAPTRFLEVDNSQIKKVKNTVQADGLAAGRLIEFGSQRAVSTRAAAGDINMTVLNKGLGLIFAQLMGGTPTIVQQGATAAWLQTFVLGDNIGKSMTIQNGIADTGSAGAAGTQRPYSFLGCKIIAAEFTCGVDELLKVKLTIDAQDVSEASGLAAPSYVTGTFPFHFGMMGVKIGTFGAEAAVVGVRKCTIKIERPQNTARFYGNGGGLKAEPIMNGRINITGSMDVDYVTKADFADRFAGDNSASLVWEFVGPTAIASTFFPTFRIRVPQYFLDGDGQTLDGPDVQMQNYPLVGKNDGTNPVATIEYMSSDIAI
jgi:hypothetical protein